MFNGRRKVNPKGTVVVSRIHLQPVKHTHRAKKVPSHEWVDNYNAIAIMSRTKYSNEELRKIRADPNKK